MAQKEVDKTQTCRADLTRTPAEADGSRRKLTEAENWEDPPLNRSIAGVNSAQALLSFQICSPDIIRMQKEVGTIQTCRADLTQTPAEADGSRRKLTEAENWAKQPLNRPISEVNSV